MTNNYDQLAIANPDIRVEQISCNIHFNWYWLMLFRLLGVCSGACVPATSKDSNQEMVNFQGLQHLSNFGVEREFWQ